MQWELGAHTPIPLPCQRFLAMQELERVFKISPNILVAGDGQ